MDTVEIEGCTIKTRIKELRKQHGYNNQARFWAKALQDICSLTTYRDLENNKLRKLDFDVLERLCAFFDCEVQDILVKK